MAFVKYDEKVKSEKPIRQKMQEVQEMQDNQDNLMTTVGEQVLDKAKKSAHVTILPPKFSTVAITIEGTTPYVQNKFSHKAMEKIREKQQAGSTAKKGSKHEAKNFYECFQEAIHVSNEGWYGIPAASIRNAMISACRIVGFQMTRAKLAVFVTADGIDATDGTPLIKITKGEPQYHESFVRNESGVIDLRARAMFPIGWQADVKVTFDADIFTLADIANLLFRAGQQVGIGEGRPDSKNSAGLGWGLFRIVESGGDGEK